MSIILSIVCIYWLIKSPKSFFITAFILACIGFVFCHPIFCVLLFLGICWIIGWISDKSSKNKTNDNQKTNYQQYNKEYRKTNYQQKTYSTNSYVYFKDCVTKEQLKKRYRNLCMKFHPDKGGDPIQFIKMQKEYESLKKKF